MHLMGMLPVLTCFSVDVGSVVYVFAVAIVEAAGAVFLAYRAAALTSDDAFDAYVVGSLNSVCNMYMQNRHKIWQRGSNNSLMGQCGGCRLPATLYDPKLKKSYCGGYMKPVKCLLDPDVGVEYLFASDSRLHLAHHEIVSQGEMIDESKKSVQHSHEIAARYEELKSATGCRGTSTPITILKYSDASTFFEYPVAHCMALGLHSQFFKQMREIIGDDHFNKACRRADKRSLYILRPSVLKRPVKRILPESSLNLLSGYKVEDHQHSMECYHVLVFHRIFTLEPERRMLKCPVATIDKVYHLYWRFLSCAMFLFRGAHGAVVTSTQSQEEIESCDRVILHLRNNFDKDVEVLCKLCEEVIGTTGCTPNLHSLHHMIRTLLVLKGHPTFEMIVERLVSIHSLLFTLSNLISFQLQVVYMFILFF